MAQKIVKLECRSMPHQAFLGRCVDFGASRGVAVVYGGHSINLLFLTVDGPDSGHAEVKTWFGLQPEVQSVEELEQGGMEL